MASDEEFELATEALEDPGAPAEIKAAARRLLQTLPAAPKGEGLGFPAGAFDVPTPEQAEAKKAQEIQPGAFDVPTEAQAGEREGRARALNAPVAKALRLREGMSSGREGPPSHLAHEPPKPYEGPAEFRGEDFDESLPTASKRKDPKFVAPPEYIPPSKAQPLDFWGHINDASQMLPAHASDGGGAAHFTEPPLAQFHRDMAPVYGDRVRAFDEFSPEYQEYSDKLWKDIYDQAVAQGRPVIRTKYSQPQTTLGKVEKGLVEHIAAPLAGAMAGASSALPFNPAKRLASLVGSDAENVERLGESSPLAHDIGFGIGAASPISTGNLAVRGGAALLPRAAGALASRVPEAVRRIAGNATAGYVSGGAQSLGTDLERGDLEGSLERANTAGLTGVPLAVGGGELMGALQREGRSLRRESPLGEAEKIGARTSVTSGIKPGARLEGLREEAAAAQIGPAHQPDVEAMLAGRLEGPLVAEGRRLRGTEEARVGKALEQFHNININEKRAPAKYAVALSKLHAGVTDDLGNPLPENAPFARQLREKVNDLVDIHLVPHGSPEEQAAFWKSDAEHQAFDEARMGERFEIRDPFATPIGEGKTAIAGEGTVSNKFGTEKTTPTPVSTREAERTAPGGKAIPAGERTTPDEVTPVGLSDLEFPRTTPREKSPLRGPGESAIERAEKQGFNAYEAVGRAFGQDAQWARENYPTLSTKFDVVIAPRTFRPGQFHQIVKGVNEMNKEGARVPPDSRLVEGTSRAIREDRDKFTGTSPEIPRNLEYEVKDEQGRPIKLRGYSAFEAKSSDELAALKRKLELAGVGGNPPELLPGSPYRGFVGTARGYGGAGRAPGTDEALRELAASAEPRHPGTKQTLDEIKRARAVAELEKAAKITQMFRGYGGVINPVERMTAMGLRLRLDPMLQFLAPKLGGLGAAGATGPQREYRNRLPPQADEATIDQISQMLGFGP